MDKKLLASVFATAAAVAFVTAPLTATTVQAASHKVKCYGLDACKDKKNCKGKGYLMKTEKQCMKLHGTTEEPTKEPAKEPTK